MSGEASGCGASNGARSIYALAAVAGLTGAAGVALAAAAAHRVESPALSVAATMIMIHSAAILALAALLLRSQHPKVWFGSAVAMLAGLTLFGGDIAFNTLAGQHLFAYAAPTGGMLLIASWLGVALAGVLEMRSARRAS